MRPPVRPRGAAIPVHLSLHTFLDVICRMSHFLRDDGGSAESGTGIWGGPASVPAHSLLAGSHAHTDSRYMFADPTSVSVFWSLVQNRFSLMT